MRQSLSFFGIVFGLSDSFWLSDNSKNFYVPDVRFLGGIGHLATATCSGCPILPHYRTSSNQDMLCLSDSSALSDIVRYPCACNTKRLSIKRQPSVFIMLFDNPQPIPKLLFCVQVRLMDPEQIPFRIEVVSLPSHPGQRILRHRDFAALL